MTNNNKQGLTREKTLYQYSKALETGDFASIEEILQQAETDPILEQGLLELNFVYQNEVFQETDKAENFKVIKPEIVNEKDQTLRKLAKSKRASTVMQKNKAADSSQIMDLSTINTDFGNDISIKGKRPRNFWSLALVAALVIVVIGGIIVITTSSLNQSKLSTAPQTLAPISLTPPDLSYPAATLLILNEKQVFPNGRPSLYKDQTLGGLAVADDYKKVSDYYKQKLTAQGYAVENKGAQNCGNAVCDQSDVLEAQNGQIQLYIGIYNPQAWDSSSTNNQISSQVPDSLIKQLQPNQTLIFYMYGPVLIPDNTPTAAPIFSPTPLATNSTAFIGPDNLFHQDTDKSLVSSQPSTTTKTSSNDTFQLNWLISDANSLHLQAIQVFTPTQHSNQQPTNFSSPSDIGSLIDESGHIYPLILDSTTAKDKQTHIWTMHGPSLPANVRKVTFKPGAGLPFSLNNALSLQLETPKQANLPQAIPFPNAAIEQNGIKFQVLYGYFGSDRTLLDTIIDVSNAPIAHSGDFFGVVPIILSTIISDTSSNILILTNDKGQQLRPVPFSYDQPYYANYNVPRESSNGNQIETILSFQPLLTGTKSISLRLQDVDVNVHLNSVIGSKDQPVLSIPLKDLRQQNSTQLNTIVDIAGFKVKIISDSVTLDKTDNREKINITYQTVSSANLMGVELKSMAFQCLSGCGSNSVWGSGGEGDSNGVQADTISFQYDPSNNAVIKLGVTLLTYELVGPWQLDLNPNR